MDLHDYDDIIHDENDEEGNDVTDSLDDKRASKQNKLTAKTGQISPTEQSSDGSIGSGSGMDDEDGTSISQNG